MSIHTSTLSQPSGRTFIAYVFRDADSFILTPETSEFSADVLSDLQGNARVPYRVVYEERAPGSYYANIDVVNFLDGDYTLEARELSNGIEYSNVLQDVFSVAGGDISSTDVVIKITASPAKALFTYIQSVHSSLFYSAETLTLSALNLASSTSETRSTFRHAFNEEFPSKYVLLINAQNIPNGTYSFRTYELVGDIEIEAGEAHIVRVQGGKQLSGIDFGEVNLSADTGGKDNLRYLEASGSPVVGASVTVYLTNEYRQDNINNPLGKTVTSSDGRWETPVSVEPGSTYTVVFYKRGSFGPNSTEVLV